MKKLKIAVLGGGPSSEHEVSLWSAKKVLESLDLQKYDALAVTIGQDSLWDCNGQKLAPEAGAKWLKDNDVDVAFLALHGTYGEDGGVQKLLEGAGVRYTGSGPEASAKAMNKVESLGEYKKLGFTLASSKVISQNQWQKHELPELDYPVIIKPVEGGSSVGMSLVRDQSQLEEALAEGFKYDDELLAEQFIEGIEGTCGILDNGKPMALPVTEIRPKGNALFDYAAKYEVGGSEEITPAEFAPAISQEIQRIALEAHKALGCYGMSRTDVIVSGDKIYVLETNTIPGLTQTSLLPQGAAAAGMSYSQMLDFVIDAAVKH